MIVVRFALQKDGRHRPPKRTQHERSPRIQNVQTAFFPPVLLPAPNAADKQIGTLSSDSPPNISADDCSNNNNNNSKYSIEKGNEKGPFFDRLLLLVRRFILSLDNTTATRV